MKAVSDILCEMAEQERRGSRVNALEYLIGEFFTPLRPVPLRCVLEWDLDDNLCLSVFARDSKGRGCARQTLSGVLLMQRPSLYRVIEKTVRWAMDGALTMHLLDHETQQGWPPRDCLHDHVDGAEA